MRPTTSTAAAANRSGRPLMKFFASSQAAANLRAILTILLAEYLLEGSLLAQHRARRRQHIHPETRRGLSRQPLHHAVRRRLVPPPASRPLLDDAGVRCRP